jgi:hypothetical protein
MGKDVPKFDTLEAFWPYYLQEHRDPRNRALHFVGTTIVIVTLLTGIATMNPWWFLAMPLAGYGFAWVGHFVVEKNRPATFTYPWWSLVCDFRMYFYTLSGKLGPELQRAVGG